MAEKTAKEKMLDLIKNKQSGGRSKTMADPKNDVKNMRKGPKLFNSYCEASSTKLEGVFFIKKQILSPPNLFFTAK